MATVHTTKESVLAGQVKSYLNPYEEFELTADYPGVSGWIASIKVNVMIHRKHTRKDLFIYHSVYSAVSLSALPSMGWIEFFLDNARHAYKELLNKGEYSGEEFIGGEWQSVRRRYNKWIYYDRTNQRLVGKVHDAK